MKQPTVLTFDEWRARVVAAAETADQLVSIVEEKTTGPGQSVLALMLAARALCAAYPELPSFEWYFHRVSELRSREPPS